MFGHSRPTVVGVDGCRNGWVVARAGDGLQADVVADLDEVVAEVRAGAVAAMAIDMPIGLLDDRSRLCDIETRRALGPRRASVFPAPVRSTLAATDYAEACELSRAAMGKAMSKQTFNLLPRIRHVDELLRADDADSIVEAHPECGFARLRGEPLESKHTPTGRQQRIDLLQQALGRPFTDLLATADAPVGDLLDAAVLTITAARLLDGTFVRFGDEIDVTGKRASVFC